MNNEKELPNLGTPEEAESKMKDSYLSFLDTCSKFVTLCDFYSDKTNEGKPLPQTFLSSYIANKEKLAKASPQDFFIMMAFYTAFSLDFLSDVKTNLDDYHDLIEKKRDERGLSDYDKYCDSLAVRDTFIDLKNDIDEANYQIAQDKELETNLNDPAFDPNAVTSI